VPNTETAHQLQLSQPKPKAVTLTYAWKQSRRYSSSEVLDL